MPRSTPPPPPKTLGNGRYELLEAIGNGGMATVYRVHDHWDGVQRALKLLSSQNASVEKTRTRFLHEAQTMAQLDHPNIARIYGIGDEDEHRYFVMELAPDGSLASFMRRTGRCQPGEALGFIYQVLQGLDHAHTAGVVHRDVKPHNMLLAGTDIKLTDFGIARVLAASANARITGTGDTLGTLAYMSPEQRMDPRKAGPATDIYGVGATLYILVTGRRPFDLAMAALDPSVLERLPVPLRPIVRRATAHLPSDRYQTARDMALAICEAWERLDPDAVSADRRMEDFALDGDTTIIQVQHPDDPDDPVS